MNMRRIAALLCALLCLAGSALADTTFTFDVMHYGDEAFQMHLRDEINLLVYQGEEYPLEDDRFEFDNARTLYGGKTRAVYEMTVPRNSFTQADSNILLGRVTINIPQKATLLVGRGNRRSGEYTFAEPITLTDVYHEDVYVPQDENGYPLLVDIVYLYSYVVDSETRRRAATLYIDYEDFSAGYTSPATPQPTATPTVKPTATPTAVPTATPTEAPTATPTEVPTATPTAVPTATPTEVPTATPTEVPTATPTTTPTEVPTATPTTVPTEAPTAVPTEAPVPATESGMNPVWLGIAAIVIVAAAALLRKKKQPEPVKALPQPEAEPDFAAQAEALMAQIQAESDLLTDDEVCGKADALLRICRRIIRAAQEQPARSAQCRKFLSYYLPTALKLLTRFREISRSGVSAPEAAPMRESTLKGLDMIIEACQKLLDNLYKGDVMDSTLDVEILEKMLKNDGMLDNDLSLSKLLDK